MILSMTAYGIVVTILVKIDTNYQS